MYNLPRPIANFFTHNIIARYQIESQTCGVNPEFTKFILFNKHDLAQCSNCLAVFCDVPSAVCPTNLSNSSN